MLSFRWKYVHFTGKEHVFELVKIFTVTPNCCPFLLGPWRDTCTTRQKKLCFVLSYHLILKMWSCEHRQLECMESSFVEPNITTRKVPDLPSSGVATPRPIQIVMCELFLSALVNHARSTYLNRNSIAVYWIIACRIKHFSLRFLASLPVNFRCKYELQVQVSYTVSR